MITNETAWIAAFGILSFFAALWLGAELWETRRKLRRKREALRLARLDRAAIANDLMESAILNARLEESLRLTEAAYNREFSRRQQQVERQRMARWN